MVRRGCPGTADYFDVRRGVAAGALATVVMSAFMLAGRKAGTRGELPPKKITRAAAHSVGNHPDPAELKLATVGAHFGFGMAAGAGYTALDRKLRLPVPPVLKGIAYGMAVWFGSYNGWVPALGIMPPSNRDLPGRARMILVAHVIYGAILGLVARQDSRQP